MITALAAGLWIGANLSNRDQLGPGAFNQHIQQTKHAALWVAVACAHDGDFVWPAKQRLWFQTPHGWVRDSLAYVVDEGSQHGIRLGGGEVRLAQDRVWRKRGIKGKIGTILFVVLPLPVDTKLVAVEAAVGEVAARPTSPAAP